MAAMSGRPAVRPTRRYNWEAAAVWVVSLVLLVAFWVTLAVKVAGWVAG